MLITKEGPIKLEIKELKDLKKLGEFMKDNEIKVNKSQLARQLEVDRRTVSKYLEGYEKSKHREKPSKVDSYRETIKHLLSSETQLFTYRSVLYRYLCDNYGMDIPEQTFYHYLKTEPEFEQYFSKGKATTGSRTPVIRYETSPGEQAQIDWKEHIEFVLKDTGELIRLNILVLILGNSRYSVYKPAINMTREVLIHLLTESFEQLGGVPQTLLTDNMKTVMDKPRQKHRKGKVNDEFDAFSKDFGFTTVPCVAATPQTKGKVETQMKLLEEVKAYSGTLNMAELFELIERLNRRDNHRIHKGTGRIPVIEYENEKASLLPLPASVIRDRYRIKTTSVDVNPSGMVNIKRNQYSVPSMYIGKRVQYQIHDSKIYIYHENRLISYHNVTTKKLNYHTEHYMEMLSGKYTGLDSDEIKLMAKHNLEIIGGRYE